MKVYIVFAHPNHNGLCYAALEKARQGFEDAGHEVRVTDLYQEDDFDPLLRYDDPHELINMQTEESTRPYRDNIAWADKLVFIYPIWWSSMPAVLKGYIDRVYASGFAYNFKGIWPQGHLGSKTAWIINTHDTPRIVARLFQSDYGRIMKRGILRYMFGIKKTQHTVMAFDKRSTFEQRTRWLNKVYQIAHNTR